jgi:hypothetical protein
MLTHCEIHVVVHGGEFNCLARGIPGTPGIRRPSLESQDAVLWSSESAKSTPDATSILAC